MLGCVGAETRGEPIAIGEPVELGIAIVVPRGEVGAAGAAF